MRILTGSHQEYDNRLDYTSDEHSDSKRSIKQDRKPENLSVRKLQQLPVFDSNMIKGTILKNSLVLVSCITSTLLLPQMAKAASAVEENIFTQGSTDMNSEMEFDPKSASKFAADVEKNRALNSDEFIVKFENNSLGLGLTENSYKGFPVVTVSSIKYPLNNDKDADFRVNASFFQRCMILV